MIEGPIQTNNNGLVFYFDTKEPKSYVGKPTTNLLSYTDFTNIWYAYCGNGDGVVRNTTDVLAPDGTFTATKIIRGTSSTCSGAFYGWGLLHSNGSNLFTAGQTYTASVWARCESGTMQFILGLNDSHSAGTTINTTWQRITFTATASGLDRGLQFITYDTSGRVYYVWRPQTELGSYASQFVASGATPGTRSNTQGLLDLTGNCTVDLTYAAYNSSSEITFNGSSRFTSSNAIFNRSNGQEITVACWMKTSRNAGQYQIIAENRSFDTSLYNWILYQHTDNGAISFHGIAQNKSTYVPPLNQWIYVVNTVTSGGVSTLYINGVSTYVATGYTYGNSTTPSLLCVGGDGNGAECIQGSIDTVAIYNRALSASEVLKNFNSQRSRYSV